MGRLFRLPLLLPAFLLLSPPLAGAAEPASAGTFVISAFSSDQDHEEESVLGEVIASSLNLLIPFQTGWSRSESEAAAARVKGSYREQGGSLRLQAELLRPAGTGKEPLHFNLSGRTGEAGLLLVELSTLIGEALEKTFLPQVRPPLFSAPQYLLARDMPAFAPRDADEDVSQTEAFLVSAITIDSTNADACYKIGVLYTQTGRPEEGLAYLRTATDLRPDYARYHFAFGVTLTMSGRRDEALAAFLQATLIDSDSAESFLGLGLLEREMGNYEAARGAISRAQDLLPEDHSVLLAAGTTAALDGREEDARRRFEAVLGGDPRSTSAYVNLGVLEQKSGSEDLARRNFSKALASRSDSPEALNNLALLEGSNGYSPDVLAELEKAKEAGPRHWEPVMVNIAVLQLRWGLWESAEKTLKEVLERNPSSPTAGNSLGVLSLLRGKPDEALLFFRQGLVGDPESALLHYNAGLAHQLAGRKQQALVHYLKAVKSKRDFIDAHTNLAMLFESMGRQEKALTEYLKVLSSTQTRPEIYIYLGRNYAARGYDSMALETIRKAALVEASLAAPYCYLALASEKKDPAQAVKHWRQFISTVQKDPNRSFWATYAEERLSALGQSP
jgi:tetratricopeptide (TPR) repeat protein